MGRPKGGTNQRRSCEEKEQLIKEYYESEMGYKAFAKKHGISHSLFSSWLQKYEKGGAEGLRHSRRKAIPESSKDEEILRLKLIIANQQIEIETLKEKLS